MKIRKTGALLLALIVIAGLIALPVGALAEGPTVTLGAGALTNGAAVWFGAYDNSPVQWRVLSAGDDKKLPVSGAGEALLISNRVLMEDVYFRQDGSKNQWAGSDAQTWCQNFKNDTNFTVPEQTAILATSVLEKDDNSYGTTKYYYRGGNGGYLTYGAAPLNNEYFFFLSAKEADTLFATDEDRIAPGAASWWLRSPNPPYINYVGTVRDDGGVYTGSVNTPRGVRPAFNLNLNSVLFSSKIQSQSDPQTSYKLTLPDGNMTIAEGSGGISRSGNTVTVPYSIAGDDKANASHVALLITGKDDTWTAGTGWSSGAVKQYYEAVAVNDNNAASFTLPDSLANQVCGTDYAAYILAVDENGAHESDYASAPVAVTLPDSRTYPLWVGGTQVTSDNKGNILNDTGTPTAVYDPDTATLTLTNADITGTHEDHESNEYNVYSEKSGFALTVELNGENRMSGGDYALRNRLGSLKLTGTGSLTAVGTVGGIEAYTGVTIEGPDIDAEGDYYGVWTNNTLAINSGSKLTAAGTNDGAVIARTITTGDGLLITTPEDGYIGPVYTNRQSIVDADGNIAAKVVIEPGWTVTVAADPAAGGTVSGGGTYAKDGSVTVTATPAEGYAFVNWTKNDVAVSTDAGYTFTATADTALTAHFEKAYPLWIGGTRVTEMNRNKLSDNKWSYDPSAHTLTLSGFTYQGQGYVYDGSKGAAVYYNGADALTVSLSGENHITPTGGNCGIVSDNAACTLTLTGSGSLLIDSAGNTWHDYYDSAIYSKGTVVFTSGAFNLGTNEADYGVRVDNGSYVVIKDGVSAFEAKGYMAAILGPVRNAVAGTGYDDQLKNVGRLPASTEGAALTYTSGLQTKNYQKTTFPVGQYTVVFNHGDGTGNMDPMTISEGEKLKLPKCTFTPPKDDDGNDKAFNWWEVSGADGIYDADSEVLIANNCAWDGAVTVTAKWKAKIAAMIIADAEGQELDYTGAAQALLSKNGVAFGGKMAYAYGEDNTTAPTAGWDTALPEQTNAGTYYVWYKAAGDDEHYDSAARCTTAKIKPLALTVTAKPHTIHYGDALSGGGVTYSGFVNGETEETEGVLSGTLDYDSAYTQNAPVGTYALTPKGLTAKNYEITFVAGTLTVEPAGVTLTANSETRIYDGTEQSVTGFTPGVEGLSFAQTVTAGGKGTNAGTYDVTFSGVTLNETKDATGNYVVTQTVGGKLTVEPRPVTATVTAEDRDYEAGNTSVALKAGIVNEAVAGDDVTVDVSAASGVMADDGAGTDKTVTVTGVKLGGAKGGNYTLSAQPAGVTVNIGKAGSAVAKAPAAKALAYNGSAQELVIAGEAVGGTMVYALGADAATAPAADKYAPSIPTGTDPGTYTVWYMVKGDANHNDSAAACVAARIIGSDSAIVTFKVAGGAWDDGTTADKAVTLTGYEGDALKLTADQIPAVGNKPAENHKAGSWDTEPSTDTVFANGSSTTYTYTYAKKDAISATVTFKVAGGAWDDGTTEDVAVILTGHEGDALKLTADQIPAVGNKPAENHKAGAWDVKPSVETAITGNVTYTYTYEPLGEKEAATVTKAPTAKKLTYSAKAQKLVTEGTAEGGTMVYAATNKNKAPKASAYAGSIPTGTDAGAYYVWYKAVGDADHSDSKVGKVRVIVYRRSIGECAITVKDLSYTGKALNPKVTVKYGKTVLKQDKDYSLTYSKKPFNPGKYEVKVTGLGNFKDWTVKPFVVSLPAIDISDILIGRTWIKVEWYQEATIKHCEIQVSQKKDFSDKMKMRFRIDEDKEDHFKTFPGLTPGTKYHVRIRTYKTVGKETHYSAWSAVRTVTTRKTSIYMNTPVQPVEMTVGEVLDLNTLLKGDEAEAVRSWSSIDAEIAAVSPEGVVTATQPGKAAVLAILEDDEEIEFAITVKEDGIILFDIGEDDLTLDIDEDVFGDAIGDAEMNLEMEIENLD